MMATNGALSRLAFNALSLAPQGSGVQTYARELLWALPAEVQAELVAAVRDDARAQLPPLVRTITRPASGGLTRLLSGARSMPPADLVHGLDVQVPCRSKAPAVSTVHDLSVFDVPWAFSRRWIAGNQAVMRHAMRAADSVIAVSHFTAERIRARFGRQSVVVPEAAPSGLTRPDADAIEAVRSRYRLPLRFALYVGNVEPRKDLATLAAACRKCELPLILAGRVWHPAHLPREARSLGYVSGSDLPGLYGAAHVVAYPSVYEGFGLPTLEAMACGAPVVAYRIPALEEVTGDAAMLVRPHDVDGLVAALRKLLDDEYRAHLIAAGLSRCASLSWQSTATHTAGVYRALGVSC